MLEASSGTGLDCLLDNILHYTMNVKSGLAGDVPEVLWEVVIRALARVGRGCDFCGCSSFARLKEGRLRRIIRSAESALRRTGGGLCPSWRLL